MVAMKPTVYLDNTVVSYLTGRLGRDAIANGRKILTQEWWPAALEKYELVISDFVEQEAGSGDVAAAALRLAAIADLMSVDTEDPAVEQLAQALISASAMPNKARYDALHVAAAAVNGIKYLVTWNYTHLANPELLDLVEATCKAAGFTPPRIVTPDQLMVNLDRHVEGDDDVE
jgi:predicted nucleic acid-binding protein